MTTEMTTDTRTTATPEDILRRARRAWFRCGVRRSDRAALRVELAAELAGAEQTGRTGDVLGPNPAAAAVEWARSRGLADRRLRLAVILPASILAGLVVSGGVLALLADALITGRSVLGIPSAALVLTIYLGTALLAVVAMATTAGVLLAALHDTSAVVTAKTLAGALPLGGALAAAVGITVAWAQDFARGPRGGLDTIVAVLATLVATVVVARWIAVRRQNKNHDSIAT